MTPQPRPLLPAVIGLVVAALSVVLLWTAPPIGLIACVISVCLIAPWGRYTMERAVISGVVILGLIAVVFPRSGSLPLTSTTARGLISAAVIAITIAAIFRWRRSEAGSLLPKLSSVDGVVIGVFAIAAGWTVSAFIGQTPQQILSSLYFGGWDNASHFITFANTYIHESTTWTTNDGSLAWNQWYPSLHTTLYSLLQQAAGVGGLSRTGLLLPYAIWSSLAFAACAAALTWIAGDLANRWAKPLIGRRYVTVAALAAAGATGAWLLLGSPQWLLNAGFMNFLLGTTVVATVSYVSTRSWSSAATYGWFLIPLGLVSIIGLWTPLALVLAPAGVIVLVALWRRDRRIALAWVAVNVVIAGLLGFRQLSDVLAVEEGASLTEFGEHIGSVGTGMAPFNISAALVAPLIAVAVAVLLRNRSPLPVAVTGPAISCLVLAALFSVGSYSAGTSLLRSYYVLKSLDAGLIATAPVLAAGTAVALALVLRQLSALSSVAMLVIAGLVAVTAYGYVGAAPAGMSAGFRPAPGIEAGWVRVSGQGDSTIGHVILAGVAGAERYPDAWPILWEGAGLQSNFWVAGLSGTPSANQMLLYGELGEFPYAEEAVTAIENALAMYPEQGIVIVYSTEPSEVFLRSALGFVGPTQLSFEQVG